MHICPNCQRTYETGGNFCAVCGAPLVEQQASVEQAQPVVQEPVTPPITEQPVPVTPVAPVTVQQMPVEPVAPVVGQAPIAPVMPVQVQPAPVVQQPVGPQYQYVQYYQPVVSDAVPAKGKMIVGMILGIAGFAMAILGLLNTIVTADPIEAFAVAIAFTLFSFPLSLVGLILSKSCINAGAKSGMCSVGKNLGLVGLILSGVCLAIGFLALLVGVAFEENHYGDYYDYS